MDRIHIIDLNLNESALKNFDNNIPFWKQVVADFIMVRVTIAVHFPSDELFFPTRIP
jgi:hypothetical protein